MGEARPLNLLNIATWFISTCLHPCLFACTQETVPQLHAPSLYMCTCKGKDKKLADKRWKEKMQRGIKQINMIDMSSKETRKQANKREGKQTRQQTKSVVHEGQMQVQIECPQLHYVEVQMIHQKARLMHGHVSKRVQMHRKPTGGANKHGKHSITRSRKGKVCMKQPSIRRCFPNGHIQTRPCRRRM